jgi:hypothetical protein
MFALLTYLLTVCVWTPETKERTGDQEERREVGLETLKSVQFTGLDTLLRREREREREFYQQQQQHDLKHEKHGGGGAMGLSILLVAATRNPNGVQKCDEW